MGGSIRLLINRLVSYPCYYVAVIKHKIFVPCTDDFMPTHMFGNKAKSFNDSCDRAVTRTISGPLGKRISRIECLVASRSTDLPVRIHWKTIETMTDPIRAIFHMEPITDLPDIRYAQAARGKVKISSRLPNRYEIAVMFQRKATGLFSIESTMRFGVEGEGEDQHVLFCVPKRNFADDEPTTMTDQVRLHYSDQVDRHAYEGHQNLVRD